MDQKINSYAYLPDDLLIKILNNTPDTVNKLSALISANSTHINQGIHKLRELELIRTVTAEDYSNSIIAADGANIVEKMTGSDLLMSIAVGVEGLSDSPEKEWFGKGEQYYQWQDVLPHHVANTRLSQGIMFLMELSILANSAHEVRILDGSHITSILKLNSLLSAKGEEFADKEYVDALRSFLHKTYNKIIPDIPNIIEDAFGCGNIIALAKYSSSREILDSKLKEFEIPGDDKTYFSLSLSENEYTEPLPVGQSGRERGQWEEIHIRCNLDLELADGENDKLQASLNQALKRFKPSNNGGTELYFSYYKPFEHGLCYRIEMKKELATDIKKFEKYLNSIKRQIFFPEIHEPYPQYLADIIAKNISLGMGALKQAIRSDEQLNKSENFHLLLSYRSN